MNFDFSDEQKLLREQAQRYLCEHSTELRLRQCLESGDGYDRAVWRQLGEMGWMGAAIDEAQGGLGLGLQTLCVIVEELGRVLAAVPFFSTVCLGAELLKHSDSPQAAGLLRCIAVGEVIVAVATAEPGRSWSWDGLSARFDGSRITGNKGPVPDLSIADWIIVSALDAHGAPLLALVDAAAPGVGRQDLPGLDPLRPHGELALSSVPATVLIRGTAAPAVLDRVLDQAAVFAAFEQIGGADRALNMARDHTLQRFAFGRPIAGNQAVKHKLVDMLVRLELARANAYYGAWSMESSHAELPRAAAAARITATDAFEYAAEENLHLHGGIGYTWEAACHFYCRRARLLAVSLGNLACWSERLLAATPAVAA